MIEPTLALEAQAREARFRTLVFLIGLFFGAIAGSVGTLARMDHGDAAARLGPALAHCQQALRARVRHEEIVAAVADDYRAERDACFALMPLDEGSARR